MRLEEEGQSESQVRVHLRTGLCPISSVQFNETIAQALEVSVRSQEHVKICEQVAVGAQREASRTPDTAMEPTPQFPAVPPQSLPFRRTLNICGVSMNIE